MSAKADVLRMLAELSGNDGDKPKATKRSKPLQARVLRDMLPDVNAKNPFQVGDLVEQKPNSGMYNWPEDGEIAIVTSLLNAPPKAGNKRFERDDIVIMCNVEDKWVEFSVESWRFRKYEGNVE